MIYSYVYTFILINVFASSFILAVLGPAYPKDLDFNAQFPPILEKRDGIPTGHLRPLGWQNRPEDPVFEETVNIEPKQFWDKYVTKNKPVVIRGLVSGSDAIDKWNDAYLNRAYGHLDINVKSRKQKIFEKEEKMDMKRFLQGYRSEDWYLRVIMPQEMQIEAPIPNIINCGPYTEVIDEKLEKMVQLVEPYLWISAGDTSSLLHSHPEYNLHCVLDGRKDFILMPIEQLKKKKNQNWHKLLNLYETYPNSNEFISKINVDMVNGFEYKILYEVVWYWSTLIAGDCIFIPSNYLHQVRSYGRSISTTIYFTLLKQNENNKIDMKFSKCKQNAPLFDRLHIANSNFMFTYTHGDRHLTKHNMNEYDAKYFLLYLLRNDTKLYWERFEKFFMDVSYELRSSNNTGQQLDFDPLDIWNDFDKEKTMYLTEDNIRNLDKNQLTRFLNVLNTAASIHGHEYTKNKWKQHEL